MKVVLLKDVKGRGKQGDIINVNEGYARNFLFPKGDAKEADAVTINTVQQQKAAAAHKADVERQEAVALAQKIRTLAVTVTGKAGGNGKLFGAITNKEISEALQTEHGIAIDKKKIVVSEPIKAEGEYQVNVKVYSEIAAPLTVHVKLA